VVVIEEEKHRPIGEIRKDIEVVETERKDIMTRLEEILNKLKA